MKPSLRLPACFAIISGIVVISTTQLQAPATPVQAPPAFVAAGCNKPLPPIAPVAGDITGVVVCVENGILAAIQSGQTTFEDIAVALGTECGNITATGVEQIISLWLNGPPSGDASPAAAPMDVASKLRVVRHKKA